MAATPKAWMPQQFENPANLEIHRTTTAQEILRDFPEGLDYLITGVGTGGHITAVSETLKKTMKGLKTIAVEPAKSHRAERRHAHAAQDPGDRRRLRAGELPSTTSWTASSR